jgi:hypothetical protein
MDIDCGTCCGDVGSRAYLERLQCFQSLPLLRDSSLDPFRLAPDRRQK